MLGRFFKQELFKRIAIIFGVSAVLLVAALNLGDRVLGFSSPLLGIVLLLILAAATIAGQRVAIGQTIREVPRWGKMILVNLIGWVGGWILSFVVGILPAALLGGWIISLLQIIFFTLLASWLFLNWNPEAQEEAEEQYEAPSQEVFPEADETFSRGRLSAPGISPEESFPSDEIDDQEARIAARRERLLSRHQQDDDLLSE